MVFANVPDVGALWNSFFAVGCNSQVGKLLCFANSQHSYLRLMDFLRSNAGDHAEIEFGVEVTGRYWFLSARICIVMVFYQCHQRYSIRRAPRNVHLFQSLVAGAAWSARRFAELIRGHCSIENVLHWSLDVVFHEDDVQIRTDHSTENLSVVRKIAKAMLQHEPSKLSIPRKQRRAAMIDDYAASVIGLK